jgi:glycosyltransferase involved in cell wall biosynthesis
LAWFLPRGSYVITVHDCVNLNVLEGGRRFLFWFAWYWWPIKRAGAVTVISQFSRTELDRWVSLPVVRIEVIPPPVSGEFLELQDRRTGSIQRAHRRVLHVGTKPNKNLFRVVEALQDTDVTLVIVGQVNPQIRQALDRSGLLFELLSNLSRDELAEEYRKASVLCFVSTYEGFGLPIIEAQASGCAVVTSNIGSMPEASGHAAVLVDPYSVQEIRDAVLNLLSDPVLRSELVARGRRNAESHAPGLVAKRFLDTYDFVSPVRNTMPMSTGAPEGDAR